MLSTVVGITALAGDIDQLHIEINGGLQLALKIIIGLFLFGVALDVRFEDLGYVVRRPLPIAVGLVAQFVVMPALTVLLTHALDVRGSVAIGMILVVCCPAGNLSNIFTYRARGDVALSISLTTASNVVALVLTPIAVAFWTGLNSSADALMRDVSIDPWEMVLEIALLIGVPFSAGLLVSWRFPRFAERARPVVEPGALVLLLLIVVGALAGQLQTFRDYAGVVAIAIIVQNAVSLAVGNLTGRSLRLPVPSVRAMTFELGVRNTGLSVVLALGFFGDLGGVAVVAALWGMWDSFTGLLLSTWWRRASIRAGETVAVGGPTPDG